MVCLKWESVEADRGVGSNPTLDHAITTGAVMPKLLWDELEDLVKCTAGLTPLGAREAIAAMVSILRRQTSVSGRVFLEIIHDAAKLSGHMVTTGREEVIPPVPKPEKPPINAAPPTPPETLERFMDVFGDD